FKPAKFCLMFAFGVHIVEVIQLPEAVDDFELFVVYVLCDFVKTLTGAVKARRIQSAAYTEAFLVVVACLILNLNCCPYFVPFVECVKNLRIFTPL
ncbi:MAG: hypothetical protein OSJ54_14150, partial [Oscillospiraceae bacterium]|nr:hypothetical protein [Oscillospiraceae bacterium]